MAWFSGIGLPPESYHKEQEKMYGKRVDEILRTEKEVCRCWKMLFKEGLLQKENELKERLGGEYFELGRIDLEKTPTLRQHLKIFDFDGKQATHIERRNYYHADISYMGRIRKAKLMWAKLLRHVFVCKKCQSELSDEQLTYLLSQYCTSVVLRYFAKHAKDIDEFSAKIKSMCKL